MTETNQARNLLATLRDALHQLEGTLGRTRAGVDAIASQAERILFMRDGEIAQEMAPGDTRSAGFLSKLVDFDAD